MNTKTAYELEEGMQIRLYDYYGLPMIYTVTKVIRNDESGRVLIEYFDGVEKKRESFNASQYIICSLKGV